MLKNQNRTHPKSAQLATLVSSSQVQTPKDDDVFFKFVILLTA